MSDYDSLAGKWAERWSEGVTGPLEGPAENVRVEGPFTEGDIIVTAEFTLERLGAGGFIGEEFEEDTLEREMKLGMEEQNRLVKVETNPDIMSVTAHLIVPIPAADVEHISSVLENLNPNKVIVGRE